MRLPTRGWGCSARGSSTRDGSEPLPTADGALTRDEQGGGMRTVRTGPRASEEAVLTPVRPPAGPKFR